MNSAQSMAKKRQDRVMRNDLPKIQGSIAQQSWEHGEDRGAPGSNGNDQLGLSSRIEETLNTVSTPINRGTAERTERTTVKRMLYQRRWG